MARFGQIALLFAGVLAVVGSFGLHPEPERVMPAFATGVEWSALDDSNEESPHICLACLAHRSMPLPRLASVVLAPRSVATAAVLAVPSRLARLESHPPEGRAPPPLS